MIAVMGATGQVGRQIVESLLAQGRPVRAIGRNPKALAELAEAGAEIAAGDAGDAGFLAEAFRGADVVHTLQPYNPASSDFRGEQARLGEAIVTAVQKSGVRRVVVLSSLGADLPEGTGFIAASLHAQEQRLGRLTGVDLLLLRPTLFLESILAGLPFVEAMGVNADAVDPDVPVPMIATKDVAAAAVDALLSDEWHGVEVRELLGARDYTYSEATRILGAAIGRPDLQYVRLPDEDMIGALMEAGFSPDTAALHVEMGRALSNGIIVRPGGRTPANTTPTRFEDVVSELLPTPSEAS
ncbi:NmrA family NAD(P)-binding protein [Pseudonocardia aurantiaca]|uniref:NAD(P)H-binding protein n=1 Tax=Pseudonocardia aurantiaca TaxID=75290 RepID=A0ABW4FE53_9PSEU